MGGKEDGKRVRGREGKIEKNQAHSYYTCLVPQRPVERQCLQTQDQ